jgi:N-methylhydantoinase A
MAWRIGVDIGGTFIDFCILETGTNRLESLKVLTTPDDPGRELMDGLTLLEERYGLDPKEVTAFVHGTTVGINTVIQRKGARMALITTAGFEDVIELARLRMPEMYSLFCSRPEQLISRDLVFGVRERILADGSEDCALDIDDLTAAVEGARRNGAAGMIVSFLHAYRNPAHERAAKAAIAALAPDLFVFTSSAVWPVIREYERTTTAILNGYVHPRVAGYLGSLEAALKARGVPAQPMLTKSNGGVMNADAGKTACVSMLLSGTASGVMGAAFLAKDAGIPNVLTLDVGGTSADLALIVEGKPQFGSGEIIGDFPLFVPSVSVTSIGAGGGSIASVDGFGVLKVGPESAGSTPGPACYGRGGTRATITDAMAVCGFLGHAPLAYNALSMDRVRAEAAVGAVAQALGQDLQPTAEAIMQVAISEMFVEVNKLIARFGVDPRDFTLMPFGGAGPMLGCFLARELGIGAIMVPRRPGVVCALGGLIADVKSDFIRTVFVEAAPAALPGIRHSFADLRREAETWLRDEHGFAGPAVATLSADMRYHGQSFEIEVVLDEVWIATGDIDAMQDAFHRQHLAIYDFNDKAGEIQIVNLRLVIAGTTAPPTLIDAEPALGEAVPEREVEIWLDGALRRVPLYLRAALQRGHRIVGPTIIVQEDTTVCIPPGFAGHVDRHLNLQLTAEA